MNELSEINHYLADKSAEYIIAWAFNKSQRTLTTTTFGDKSAALLHMVTRQQPGASILWVDTGYNTPATYRFADELIDQLDLNMQIYTPQMTSVRRNVLMGGIPDTEEPLHEEFTRQVKLEPFQRATNILKPPIWLTGIRREQTDYRRSLDIVSCTEDGYYKVAPLLNWNEEQLENYLEVNNLPNEPDYFDPTKVSEARECGLHTRI
jgi:phosphoadenosine phosphosulfate reductase